MYRISTFQHVDRFLAKAQRYLEQDEVVNGLILGVSLRLAAHPGRFRRRPYLAVVEGVEGIEAVATMTPPYGILLASHHEGVKDALDLIAENLIAGGWPVPDVNGPKPISEKFALVWARKTGVSYTLGMAERLYRLQQVTGPNSASGQMRPATEEDIDLVVGWLLAFQREALPTELFDGPRAQQVARNRVEEGSLFLWEDGQPVSMAASTRPTRNGIAVSMVYTPPEFRRRGYATASVAQLSRLLLHSGYQFCTLFTDLTNPTSNSIYMKIGYEPVCDFDKYVFETEGS